MYIEKIKLINISVEMCGILLCLCGIIVSWIGTKIEKKTAKYFSAIFLCLSIDLISNLAGQIFKGKLDTMSFAIVRISNFCEFFFGYLLAFLVTWYMLYCMDKKNRQKKLRTGVLLLYGMEILLLCYSQFNNMYYYIDEYNIYHRGRMFWLSQTMSIVTMFLNVLILLHNKEKFSKRERQAFQSYIYLPIIALFVQLFFYGYYLVLFAAIISAAIMFVFIVGDQMEKYSDQEMENANLRVEIMMNQIQPHFLYNSLDSIYYLCSKDPKKAQKAISDFADYLRMNLNSLKRKTPIPFEKELNHVKTYLSLEKMSSDDTLHAEFDIETENFFIPALSVQPLVENAVKHGIGKNAEGGTVVIATREYEDRYEIIVSDDGVGFDPSLQNNDAKEHIGIENVRQRISMMCQGTLTIISSKGKGTRAVITIPKNTFRDEAGRL